MPRESPAGVAHISLSVRLVDDGGTGWAKARQKGRLVSKPRFFIILSSSLFSFIRGSFCCVRVITGSPSSSSLILVTLAAAGCPVSVAPHWHLLMSRRHSTCTHTHTHRNELACKHGNWWIKKNIYTSVVKVVNPNHRSFWRQAAGATVSQWGDSDLHTPTHTLIPAERQAEANTIQGTWCCHLEECQLLSRNFLHPEVND